MAALLKQRATGYRYVLYFSQLADHKMSITVTVLMALVTFFDDEIGHCILN